MLTRINPAAVALLSNQLKKKLREQHAAMVSEIETERPVSPHQAGDRRKRYPRAELGSPAASKGRACASCWPRADRLLVLYRVGDSSSSFGDRLWSAIRQLTTF